MTPPDPQPPADPGLDLWNQANDVLYVHDLKGRFTAVNAIGVQAYGYTEAEFLAMDIGQLVDPASLATAQGNLQAKAVGTTDRTGPYELLTRSKAGQPVWVEVSTRLLQRGGKPSAVYGAARIITARKQAEAVSELVHEASLALNAASSLEAGVGDAITRVAKAAGWTYAEAWFPDAEGKALVLGPQWVGASGLEKFARLAKQYQFTRGEGTPGRVWATGKPLWSDELPPEDDCPRRGPAMAAGLRVFTAVPVVHDDKVACVLLFLGTAAPPGNERWVEAAQKVAAHLGASIGRRLDAERVRSAARMFAAQFEALEDAILLLDTEGRPRHANQSFLRLCGVGLRNNDAAVPLIERVDDPARFLSAVASLYEDRSDGRGAVRVGDQVLQRAVAPLRSRTGTNLGVLLRIHALAAT